MCDGDGRLAVGDVPFLCSAIKGPNWPAQQVAIEVESAVGRQQVRNREIVTERERASRGRQDRDRQRQQRARDGPASPPFYPAPFFCGVSFPSQPRQSGRPGGRQRPTRHGFQSGWRRRCSAILLCCCPSLGYFITYRHVQRKPASHAPLAPRRSSHADTAPRAIPRDQTRRWHPGVGGTNEAAGTVSGRYPAACSVPHAATTEQKSKPNHTDNTTTATGPICTRPDAIPAAALQ